MPIYRRPGASHALKMACFGDSITAGLVATYRGALASRFGTYYKKQIRWSGFNAATGGTSGAMIGASGITLETLVTSATYATESLLNGLALDVALIHIGSNDATGGKTVEQMTVWMNTLLDRLRAANPNCHVFWAKLTPNTNASPDANTVLYNDLIDSLKASRSDGAYIHIPDMRTAFLADPDWATTLMADSIHPNDAGSALMATTWYASLTSVF